MAGRGRHAGVLKLAREGNGEPLTGGHRPKLRLGNSSSCPRCLLEGAEGGTSASTRGERVGLITSSTRFLICDQDAWSGMVEPWADMVSSRCPRPDARVQTCLSAPTARKMSERPTTCRDWTALGAAITPARRPQHSPGGDASSEHGQAVHAHVRRARREGLLGSLQKSEHKIPERGPADRRPGSSRPMSHRPVPAMGTHAGRSGGYRLTRFYKVKNQRRTIGATSRPLAHRRTKKLNELRWALICISPPHHK